MPMVINVPEKATQNRLRGPATVKRLGRFLEREFQKRGVSDAYLMEKLNITKKDLEALKHSMQADITLPSGKMLDTDMLKKISGITGVGYRQLRHIAKIPRSKHYISEFYTEDGEEIDVQEILLKLYYKNPKEFRAKLLSLIDN